MRDWRRFQAHLTAQDDEAFDAGFGDLYAMSNAMLDLPSQSAEDTIAKLMALTSWCGDLEGIFPCKGQQIILNESRALPGFAPSP